MKIESTGFGADDLTRYMDELVDHERLHLAGRLEKLRGRLGELGGRVPASGSAGDGTWTAGEILAHVAVLSKFYGMLTYKIGSGQMTELELLSNVNLRDVLGEKLSRLAPGELVAMAQADQGRTVEYLRGADARAMQRVCVVDGGRSTITAGEVARLPLTAHLEQHLDQLEAALAGA